MPVAGHVQSCPPSSAVPLGGDTPSETAGRPRSDEPSPHARQHPNLNPNPELNQGPFQGRVPAGRTVVRRPIAVSGRVVEPLATPGDCRWGAAMHLAPLMAVPVAGTGIGLVAVILPLILWLVRRDESVFHDDHGREVINFCLSFLIWNVLLMVTLVGIMLIPLLWLVALVNLIRGAVAAGQGEYFRYPITFRVLS